MSRRSVDPALTFGSSLAISLVLWFPTLRAAMSADIEITDAGVRFFLTLAIAWSVVYGFCALVAACARSPRRPASPPRGPAARRPDARGFDEPTNEVSDTRAA